MKLSLNNIPTVKNISSGEGKWALVCYEYCFSLNSNEVTGDAIKLYSLIQFADPMGLRLSHSLSSYSAKCSGDSDAEVDIA